MFERNLARIKRYSVPVLLILAAALLAVSTAIASDDADAAVGDTFSSGGINYSVLSETPNQVQATGPVEKTIPAIDLPETVTHGTSTYSVTSVAPSAFKGCTSATSVTISKNIVSIGSNAFSGCTGVTSITFDAKSCPDFTSTSNLSGMGLSAKASLTIGPNVTSIPAFAFYKCTSITTVNIPDNVLTVGRYAFSGAYNITTVNIAESSKLQSISDFAFNACTKLSSLDLSDTKVTSIGEKAFYQSALVSVSFPSTLNNISQYAFSECGKLVSADLSGTSVTTIGICAFYKCYYLEEVTIPETVTSLGSSSFAYCTRVTQIDFDSPHNCIAKEATVFISVGSSGSGTTVTFGTKVTKVPAYTFYYSSTVYNNLVSIEYEGTIAEIGDYAFFNCHNLLSVTIPDSVTSIGRAAYYSCYKIETVTIPVNVTSIGPSAFYGCSKMTEVYYNARNVGDFESGGTPFNLAYGTTLSRTFIFGEGVEHIPAYICCGSTSNVVSVSISSTVTSVGKCAFCSNIRLTSVTVLGNPTFGEQCFTSGSTYNKVTCNVYSMLSPGFLNSYGGSYITFNYVQLPHVSLGLGGKDIDSVPSGWLPYNGKLLRYYDYGETITIPELHVTGYDFTGWDKTPAASMGSETLQYTASWKIRSVTLTFDSNGGSPVSPVTADYGTAVNVQPPTLTGYTFTGWNPQVPATMPESDQSFTATWEIQHHTVKYVTYSTAVPSVTLDYGEVIPLPTISREGYTFVSWSIPAGTTMGEEDVTVTASWKIKSATLTFDSKGGSAVSSVTADYGTPVSIPDPVLKGYTFMGWDPQLPSKMPETDQKFTATWEIQHHKVDYVTGSTPVPSVTIDYGQVIPLPEVSREGYTFVSWSIPEGTLMGEKDVTVTASWLLKTVTLTFNSNGGSAVASLTAKYGTKVTVESPVRTGYTFAGWNPQLPSTMPAEDQTFTATWELQSHTVTYVTNAAYIAPAEVGYGQVIPLPNISREGYTFVSWSIPAGIKMGESDITVTASWSPNDITLYFNLNGGQGSNSVTGKVGEKVTVQTPTKTGSIFNGWSPSVPQYFPTKNATYSASWTLEVHKVYYDTDGGTSISSTSVSYGKVIPLPTVTPVKTGYTFKGWDLPANTVMQSSDVTVHAQWEGEYFRVYYNNEYGVPVFLQDYQAGEPISGLKAPTLEGYRFVGWKDAPESMPANNIALDCIWVPEEHKDSTVIYIAAGGIIAALGCAGAVLLIRHKP